MARFRKRPETVEAVKWLGDSDSLRRIHEIKAGLGIDIEEMDESKLKLIERGFSWDRHQVVNQGDWVVADAGGVYAISEEVFSRIYELDEVVGG